MTGASAYGSVAGWDINIYNNREFTPSLSFWVPTGGGYDATNFIGATG